MYAPVPQNYFCKACGMQNDHWIMTCQYKTVFNHSKNVQIIPKILDMDGKSIAWNSSRIQEYKSIYDSISQSPFCSDAKYKTLFGSVPQIIIKNIAFYTVSCCDVLSCDNCKKEINSYSFEKINKANSEICDYYLSDDYEENHKIFCSKCCNNYSVRKCEIKDCRKLDKVKLKKPRSGGYIDSNFIGLRYCNVCDEGYCSRHDVTLFDQCSTCKARLCPNCSKHEICNVCATMICFSCKSCCNGCAGTDSCHDCFIHQQCIKSLSKCGVCQEYFCQAWEYDGQRCERCDVFIDVNCIPYPFNKNMTLLCNKCNF